MAGLLPEPLQATAVEPSRWEGVPEGAWDDVNASSGLYTRLTLCSRETLAESRSGGWDIAQHILMGGRSTT